jgi:polysaccharide pyruvyl transferase WcaK-like protein
VAFALEPRRPRNGIAERIEQLGGDTIAGINISGLLRESSAIDRFGLVGDYVSTVTELVRTLIESGARVLLVPHVHVPGGDGESDIAAINVVLDRLSESARSRVTVVPSELDAAEMKWCISRCEWFAGSRMHATIGALSSQVPACGYAYSDKTLGVFETCGMGDHVVDARVSSGAEAVKAMTASFAARQTVKLELERRIPDVVQRARGQLTDILDDVWAWRAGQALGAIA